MYVSTIHTVCKFQEFHATRILREINFGHFDLKTATLTISATAKIDFTLNLSDRKILQSPPHCVTSGK